jgi:RNA polymerase sigma-70 factor (ECF subfamily)
MELLPGPDGGLTKPGFDSLYLREHRRLWLLAAGLTGRAADADDVLQEAVMLAYGKRNRFTPTGEVEADSSAFCAWLGRFVRNVASNYTRRRHRLSRRRSEGVDPADLGRERSSHEQHAKVEDAALAGEIPLWQEAFDDQVAKALERIKPIWRTCLLMNVVAGLTQAEIAVALEMRENTVASHIRRGRERMRELLEASAPVTPGATHGAASISAARGQPRAPHGDEEAPEAPEGVERRVLTGSG